jgi:NAD(P)-dependent dehydrogenase (short-subunit alcohol dehydrogenase family)
MNQGGNLFDLSGRAVLVTGAGRGLGRAMALAAVRAGARVVGVARSAGQLREAAAEAAELGGELVPLPWDVADIDRLDDLIEAATERVGLLTGVVHGAGIQVRAPATEIKPDQWRSLMRVNLEAPFFLSVALANRQRAAGVTGQTDASHIFIASLTSFIAVPDTAAYSASKSGLLGVVRSLAVEWARDGIRANAIAPGYYHTELTDALFTDPKKHAWLLSRIPMGRTGEPEDLAGATVFLLSAASRYITGQVVTVDGGWLAS